MAKIEYEDGCELVSLKVISKLDLNRNNKRYFQKICSDLEAHNSRGITSTNKLLRKCFEFFSKKSFGNSGAEIAQFIANFSSSMVFTKIIVQDDLNAYKVFETLNARGVQLSTPDLLKNYLFSIVTKDEKIGDEELDDLDKQFSSMRKVVTTPEEAYKYIKSLIDFSPIYASLINPNDAWWADQDVKYKEALHFLSGIRLFNIKQPLTILLAAFNKFSLEEFVNLARYLYVLSIRYNIICHLSPSEQESVYNQIAIKISNEEYKRASHVKNGDEFKRLYPDDNTFFNAFEFHRMPSRQTAKKIRFLLAEIERSLGNNCEYEKTTLEHICPYNPERDWVDSFGEGVNDVKDRLGNMILMDKDNLKRVPFDRKKEEYRKSNYKLALKITEYEDWNLDTVNDFQKWMSEKAVNAWKVS
ncbi:DUF262 domain-containing protein [Photorhabdus tasmaniensis]|uniref:DUF262 domain-containing protein n=1 Tax=Photorhabdus tasmaniensis TaxID=1004159 RepID=UPI001F616C7E|nr:HNH endonuclease family protein [Photorhabdus tasmaniensis]